MKQLAVIMKKTTRSFDTVSRTGGEEFSVILSDCPSIKAFEVAERIRTEVENHAFVISSSEKIINHADNCLYHAKKLGRNNACTSC